MNNDELHERLDELVPDVTRGRISTRIIGHALIELGLVTKLECSWDQCKEETREFEVFVSSGRGKRHPRTLSVDHVVSRSDGGSDLPSNIQLLHFVCNVRKGSIDARKNPVIAQKHKDAMSKRWNDPEYRSMMAKLPRPKSSKGRESQRQSMKEQWSNPETRAKRLEAVRRGQETRRANKLKQQTQDKE